MLLVMNMHPHAGVLARYPSLQIVAWNVEKGRRFRPDLSPGQRGASIQTSAQPSTAAS